MTDGDAEQKGVIRVVTRLRLKAQEVGGEMEDAEWRATLIGAEFGEGVLFRPTTSRKDLQRLAKLSTVCEEGIYFGNRAKSGECVVGTSEGIFKTRPIHRKPVVERWDPENA